MFTRSGIFQTATADRIAFVGVMLLPLFLLHAHGIAEGVLGVIDFCFLLRCALLHEWRWLRTRWVQFAAAWWGWLVVCSLPIAGTTLGEGGVRSLIQALLTVRFLLLAATMEFLVLQTAETRRLLYRLFAASALWIAVNSLIQHVLGRNLLGWPPAAEGVLTGPFGTARAGPPMARIIIPVVLPPVTALLSRPGLSATVGAYALLSGAVVIMLMIGQRMPLILTLFGLLIVACLIRQMRPVVLATALIGGLVLAASPIVAPNSYYRLVDKFSNQIEHFATSPYGQLYARAWQVGLKNPITGMGFDGFATGCPRPEYFRPSFDGSQPNGGGAVICWNHPHNYYLQALDDGGFIGLILFATMSGAWLLPLARGLGGNSDPLRVGLFAAICIQVWPIQSTTGFTSMPVAGWFFMLVGWAMAEARQRNDGSNCS